LQQKGRINFLNKHTLIAFSSSKETIMGEKESYYGGKGKHASSTEKRRIVWEYVVWPLILQVNRQYFTLQEYRTMRDEFSRIYDIQSPLRLSGGLISLVDKGILAKNKDLYSIDYRLISYMRRKAKLQYGFAVKQTFAKQ
jgi:hypothetical protein